MGHVQDRPGGDADCGDYARHPGHRESVADECLVPTGPAHVHGRTAANTLRWPRLPDAGSMPVPPVVIRAPGAHRGALVAGRSAIE